jgi:hypothetical protein
MSLQAEYDALLVEYETTPYLSDEDEEAVKVELAELQKRIAQVELDDVCDSHEMWLEELYYEDYWRSVCEGDRRP